MITQSSELQRAAEQAERNERRLARWRKRYMWYALEQFEARRAAMSLVAHGIMSDRLDLERAYQKAFHYLHQAD